MGYNLIDQYSLLHFCVGVIVYFWNFPLLFSFIIHFLFEILENTERGVFYINKYIIEPGYFSWPGGKHKPDTTLNMIGDNLFFVIGWVTAWYLDKLGIQNHWYMK